MNRRGGLRRLCLGLWLGGWAGLSGCDRQSPPARYETFSGTVTARQADTGKFSVRVDPPRGNTLPDGTLFCVATKDSEIYLNDKFSPMEVIQVGDPVEVIGYRDSNKEVEFVASFVYIGRETPPLRTEGKPSPVEPVPASQSVVKEP